MSRKHNTKHGRSKSRYPKRLAARGITAAAARMKDHIGVNKGKGGQQ